MTFLVALVVLAVTVGLIARALRGSRRISQGEMEKIGPMPTGPVVPGAAYLFPGQGEMKDADHREAPISTVNRSSSPSLPPGVRRDDA